MRTERPTWAELLRLPDAISWISLVCGLLALYVGLELQRFGAAFGLLFAAAVLDNCDGAVARKLGLSRTFGGYFDTMVDTIIFLPVVSVLTYQLGLRFLPLHLAFNTCGALRHARLLAYPEIKKHGVPSTIAGFAFPIAYAGAKWLDLDVPIVLGVIMAIHSVGMIARVDLLARHAPPAQPENAAG